MNRRGHIVRLLSSSRVLPLLAARPRWNGVVILTYHRIGNPAESSVDRNVFSATADEFERQIAYLKSAADVVHSSDIPDLIVKPGRHVMISFDDGYRDNYDHAFPVLKAHGVPATFFLCTGFLDRLAVPWWDEIAWLIRNSPLLQLYLAPWIDRPLPLGRGSVERTIRTVLARYKALPSCSATEMVAALRQRSGSPPLDRAVADNEWMTWDMAREMARGGMEIGGHTTTHPLLSRLDAGAQRREIDGGQRRLVEELGQPATAFAYPVGSADAFDATTKSAVAAAGFNRAFSFHGGYANVSTWDPFDIPRTYVAAGTEPPTLRAMLAVPQLVLSTPSARSLLRPASAGRGPR